MELLRSIYDALAVIGTIVIVIVVVLIGADFYGNATRPEPAYVRNPEQVAAVERRQERARQARAGELASSPSTTPPAPLGLPLGLREAQSRGVLHDADSHLLVVIDEHPVPGARTAWVERHGENNYLLVANDSVFLTRLPAGGKWALELRDGRRIRLTQFADVNNRRFVFARLCAPPPAGLRAVAVPRDSFTNRPWLKCE